MSQSGAGVLCLLRHLNGSSGCLSAQAIKIDPRNGIPYLPGSPRFGADDGLPFNLAAHGGPWHLHEAIRTSKYFTSNVDTADIVYVYDHCLYIQWLAQVIFDFSGLEKSRQ